MTRGPGRLLLPVLAALAGAAAAKELNPYEIPKEQFAARIQVIALETPRVPADVANPARVRTWIEEQLTQRLRAKGYRVIASREHATLWRQLSERLGGTFDPVTGKPRQAQADAARDHVGRELERLHGVDALLSSYVTVVPGRAQRQGRHYKAMGRTLFWQGEPISSWVGNVPQQVRGLSLNVLITDVGNANLYGIRVPLQWIEVYFARGHERKPANFILDEPWLISNAVDRTLQMIVPAPNGAAPATPNP